MQTRTIPKSRVLHKELPLNEWHNPQGSFKDPGRKFISGINKICLQSSFNQK